MDEILEILSKDARRTPDDIAKLTRKNVAVVKKAIKGYEDNGTIVQYKAVINQQMLKSKKSVVALIEVGITPQKDQGFDAIAERIYNFP